MPLGCVWIKKNIKRIVTKIKTNILADEWVEVWYFSSADLNKRETAFELAISMICND